MIKLNNGYSVEIDNLNYILKKEYESTSKDGQAKKSEKTIGFFGNMKDLLERYLECSQKDAIGESEIDMAEYVRMVERSNEMAVEGLKDALDKFPVK